jgi:hypothetical protein
MVEALRREVQRDFGGTLVVANDLDEIMVPL